MPAPRRVIADLNEGQDPPEQEEREEEALEAGDEDVGDEDPDPQDDEQDEDAEAGDDEAEEGDDETPIGDEEEERPVRHARQQSRGNRTIAQLRKDRRDAEERAHQLELENLRLRNGGGNRQEPESAAVRNARLEAMTPEERTEFRLSELQAEMRNGRAADAFRSADREDYNRFQAEAKKNPTYAKHASAVERRLEIMRAQGQNVPRESILKFLLGDLILKGRDSPKAKKQRDAAQRRVENERVALPRGRGERGGSRSGSKSADLEKRLANVPI